MFTEDREDLKIFEEGVSHPKANHAAWTAAASSLQMRSALPEVGILISQCLQFRGNQESP